MNIYLASDTVEKVVEWVRISRFLIEYYDSKVLILLKIGLERQIKLIRIFDARTWKVC